MAPLSTQFLLLAAGLFVSCSRTYSVRPFWVLGGSAMCGTSPAAEPRSQKIESRQGWCYSVTCVFLVTCVGEPPPGRPVWVHKVAPNSPIYPYYMLYTWPRTAYMAPYGLYMAHTAN